MGRRSISGRTNGMEELVEGDFENGCFVEVFSAKNSNPANIERQDRGIALGPLL